MISNIVVLVIFVKPFYFFFAKCSAAMYYVTNALCLQGRIESIVSSGLKAIERVRDHRINER